MGKITKPGPGLPLLFINKDATNLTRTPAEAFAIGSHTSKAYRKWAKSERLRRIRLTDSVAQSTKAYLKISPRAQRSLIEECEQIEEAEDPQAFAALLKAITYQDVSVHTKSSIPTTLKDFHVPGHSPSLYRATEYFIRVLVPNNTPVYSIFEVSNVNCLYFLEIIASSSAQYLYHSAFALLHLVVENVVPQTSSSRIALQHTVAAISLLRKIISEHPDQTDDATFVAVVCLASFSRALGDYTGYSIHRNRIAQMMESRGGLQNTGLQGFVKALTLQFAPPNCIPLALCFNQLPKPATVDADDTTDHFFYDHRRFLPELPPSSPLNAKLATALQRLPFGFQSLVLQTSLSTNTTELLFRIADARTKQAQSRGYNQKESLPIGGGGWQVARYSDFWECCPSISRTGPDLEKYLCLALLLYTANEFAPERACHKGMALYSGPRALLAAEIGLLAGTQLTLWQRHCSMWIWWVVIDSWNEADTITETGRLMMTQFWLAFPEVHCWSKLKEILAHFFWAGKFEAAVARLEAAAPSSAAATALSDAQEKQ